MAFTNGSLYGKFDGQSHANNGFAANNSSNLNNPNASSAKDLFQILAPGGACLLQVTAAYAVNTNVAAGSFTPDVVIAKVQMVITAYNSLPASPTAAQICAAAFPLNYANQQLDLFQIETDITAGAPGAVGTVLGGGAVIWRLLYNGSTATS